MFLFHCCPTAFQVTFPQNSSRFYSFPKNSSHLLPPPFDFYFLPFCFLPCLLFFALTFSLLALLLSHFPSLSSLPSSLPLALIRLVHELKPNAQNCKFDSHFIYPLDTFSNNPRSPPVWC